MTIVTHISVYLIILYIQRLTQIFCKGSIFVDSKDVVVVERDRGDNREGGKRPQIKKKSNEERVLPVSTTFVK